MAYEISFKEKENAQKGYMGLRKYLRYTLQTKRIQEINLEGKLLTIPDENMLNILETNLSKQNKGRKVKIKVVEIPNYTKTKA